MDWVSGHTLFEEAKYIYEYYSRNEEKHFIVISTLWHCHSICAATALSYVLMPKFKPTIPTTLLKNPESDHAQDKPYSIENVHLLPSGRRVHPRFCD